MAEMNSLKEVIKSCDGPIDYKAYRLTLTSPMEKEELIGVGRVAAVEAFHTFEEGKGMTVRSWCLTLAEQRMFKHTRKEIRRHHDNTSRNEEEGLHNTPTINIELEQSIFMESLQQVSPHSKEVLRIIFRMPLEIVKVLAENKPKKARGRLRHILKMEGWKDRQINETFRELKAFLVS